MAQVPVARIVGRAQFGDQPGCVGAGGQFGLGVGSEALDQMIDVHMGKADDADTKVVGHG